MKKDFEKEIFVAGLVYDSLVDGDGLRSVVFLSGCTVKCKGCHNKAFWDKKQGKKYIIEELAKEIIENTPQAKVTISGGEALEQKEAVYLLIKKLKEFSKDFDIGLYTSYELEQVDEKILKNLRFIKTGKFEESLKIKNKYFGSSNQKFHYIQDIL